MDMLRALGRIYHAKNLHSARSHFKGRGTVFQPASGEEGRGEKEARQRAFVSRSDRNWRGAFKEEEIELIWDEVFFSQHGSVPQSSKNGEK